MTHDTSALRHYVPAAALALALFLRWLFDPWLHEAWAAALVFGAVAAAVWYGGYRQAITIALLGYIAADWLFIEPRGSLSLDPAHLLGLLIYSISCGLIIALGHHARRVQAEARSAAELLGRALAGARMAAWEWDVADDTLRLSASTPDMFGAGRVFKPSRRLLPHIHPDDREVHLRAVRKVLRGGETIEYEFRVVRPDGSVVWIESRGDVVRDKTGRARLVRGVLVDVTERSLAQQALREAERRLQVSQDLAPHGYALLESVRNGEGRIADFRVAYINAAGASLAHRSPDEIVGRRVLEVFPNVASTLLFQRVRNTCETGKAEDFEVCYPDERGGAWFRYLLAKVDGAVAASFIDVTATKRLEEELRRRADALKEADKRKNEFLAVLAHELRNPLAPVATSLQILKRLGGDARTVRTLDVMERQLAQIVHLIDDLLDISRIEQGKTALHRAVIELQEAIVQGIDTAEPHIRAKGHELTVDMTPVPLHVHADPMRIAQVVANLLNNAAKYTHSHGYIRLGLRSEAGHAVISVEDNGIGIPHDKLKTIFDLFVQVDRSSDHAGGGLGLGLTLAKNLVEIHGGTIEAKSEGLGRGSTFIVRLPLVVEPALERRPREDARSAAAPRHRRILVVDDNQDAAETLAQLLRLGGDEVRTTDNGEEALAIGPEFRPHVAILDLGMPDIDGYELAQRIRRQRWGSGVLLVALSGWGQDEDKVRSREAGFDHHLTKPVSPDDLEQVLEHHAAL